MENKRILIINGQSLYRNNATGITLRSIVENIPSESLMELYRFETKDPIKGKYAFQSLQIPPKAMPFNFIIRKCSGHDNYYELGENKALDIQKKENESKFGLKRKMFLTLKAFAENTPLFPTTDFLREVDRFKPDYVYTMGASFFVLNWTYYFQKRYDCHVVIHYMDNWRETMYTDGSSPAFFNSILQNKLYRLEKNMRIGLTISQYMAEAYHEKYGFEYLPLMNVVPKMDCEKNNDGIIRFVYAGGLHLDRDKQLLHIERALKKVKEKGNNVSLEIYTSKANKRTYESDFDCTITHFNCAVPHEKVMEIYNKADVLIHVESFDKEIIEYTKYSMSTKIPEYMAAGKVIFCLAPENIASFKYIKKSETGVCVSDVNKILESIEYLLVDNNRRKFAENGKRIAQLNHSSDQMCSVVKSVFDLY